MNVVPVFDLSNNVVNGSYFLISLKGAIFRANVRGPAAGYSTSKRTWVSKRGDHPDSSPPVEPRGFLYFSNPILSFRLFAPTASHAKPSTSLSKGCYAE